MSSVCTEHQHQHQFFYNKKNLLELDVPPRKLLHRGGKPSSHPSPGLTVYLPNEDGRPHEEDKVGAEEGEVDANSCEEFRIYEFKVRRCVRGRSHDWTDCPFTHPGEKARRRDPRRYHYSTTPCPDHRRTDGACPRGDACELAHGVFEVWLHPARYRTMPCKEGRRCRRKVCFFAHTPSQLRVLPVQHAHSPSPLVSHKPSCCAYWPVSTAAVASASVTSPTSILMGFPDLSPPFTPPLSPPVSPSGVWSRKDNYPTAKASGGRFPSGVMSYDSVYAELLSSLEAMQLSVASAADPPAHDAGVGTSSSSSSSSSSKKVCKDFDAATTPGLDEAALGASSSVNVCKEYLSADQGLPDLGWVEELLM